MPKRCSSSSRRSRNSTTCRRSTRTSIWTSPRWRRREPSSPQPVIVLGIDPGTAITGYGVVRSDGRGASQLIECGVIRTSPRAPLASRLQDIFEGVVELIERHHPDALAVEDVFYEIGRAHV